MLNKVVLMGRLVADPELKRTNNDISVCTFRVAVDRNYTPQGQERQCDFLSCVAWRQTGEFITRYFTKGRMIAVEGSLQSRNYEDKNGVKRTAYEIIVEHAYFADSKPADNTSNAAANVDVQYTAAPAPAPAQAAYQQQPVYQQQVDYTPSQAYRAQQGYAPAPMTPDAFGQIIGAAAASGVPVQQSTVPQPPIQPVTYPAGVQQMIPLNDDGDLPF